MAASPVTPQVGSATMVVDAGDAVVAFPGNIAGGFITNPSTATTPIFIDPTGSPAATFEGGTVFALYPGQTWTAIPGQTTTTSVNGTDNNHAFTAVFWK